MERRGLGSGSGDVGLAAGWAGACGREVLEGLRCIRCPLLKGKGEVGG